MPPGEGQNTNQLNNHPHVIYMDDRTWNLSKCSRLAPVPQCSWPRPPISRLMFSRCCFGPSDALPKLGPPLRLVGSICTCDAPGAWLLAWLVGWLAGWVAWLAHSWVFVALQPVQTHLESPTVCWTELQPHGGDVNSAIIVLRQLADTTGAAVAVLTGGFLSPTCVAPMFGISFGSAGNGPPRAAQPRSWQSGLAGLQTSTIPQT